MKKFDIYEEGFCVQEGSASAHYIGEGFGDTFIDACKEYINRTGHGEIGVDEETGREYACDWGCEWFPTLSEAQRSFG